MEKNNQSRFFVVFFSFKGNEENGNSVFFLCLLKDDVFYRDCRVQRVSGSFKKGVREVIKRVWRVCVGGA